jgi:hypothetical protein
VERITVPPRDLDCTPYRDEQDEADKAIIARFKELGVLDAGAKESKDNVKADGGQRQRPADEHIRVAGPVVSDPGQEPRGERQSASDAAGAQGQPEPRPSRENTSEGQPQAGQVAPVVHVSVDVGPIADAIAVLGAAMLRAIKDQPVSPVNVTVDARRADRVSKRVTMGRDGQGRLVASVDEVKGTH